MLSQFLWHHSYFSFWLLDHCFSLVDHFSSATTYWLKTSSLSSLGSSLQRTSILVFICISYCLLGIFTFVSHRYFQLRIPKIDFIISHFPPTCFFSWVPDSEQYFIQLVTQVKNVASSSVLPSPSVSNLSRIKNNGWCLLWY